MDPDFLSSLSLPIAWLLLPLGIFFLVFMIYSVFNMYHLFRFGVYNFGLYIISTIYILETAFLVSVTIWIVLDLDWSVSFSLGDLSESASHLILPL